MSDRYKYVVYDQELDSVPTIYGVRAQDTFDKEIDVPHNADIIGHKYTVEDLDSMPKSTIIEDYTDVEPPIVDADYLGGTYTKRDIANIISNLGNINVYVSDDGKLHYVDKDGADTELPFSGGEIDVFTEVQTSSATSSSEISFSPLSKGNYIIFGGYSTKFTPTSDVSLILAPYNATGLVEYCNPIIIEVLTDNTDISSMFSVTSQSKQQISVCKIHDSIDVSNPTTVKNQYTATEDCWFAVMKGSNAPIYGLYGTALFHTYSLGGSIYLLHMKQGQTVTYGTSSGAIGILFN